MSDYKNYEPGKYPEPNERKTVKDFPKVEELFTYGFDFPVPQTHEDLRCEYGELEDLPLVPSELEGYKVPPLGITKVGKGGSGHRGGFIYPNGTFREDRISIGKSHGSSQLEVQIARAEAKKSAIMEGIEQAFEQNQTPISTKSESGVLQEMAKLVTEKVLKDTNAREARMWFNDIHRILNEQDDIKEKQTNLERLLEGVNPEDLALLDQSLKRAIMDKQYDIIEGEFEDIEDGDDED